MKFLELIAASQGKIDPGSIGVKPVTNADGALTSLLNTAYMGAGILCVIVIIIAGYFYVTSSGDPSSTKRAREAIIGAVTGLIIILMAFGITQFVLGRF